MIAGHEPSSIRDSASEEIDPIPEHGAVDLESEIVSARNIDTCKRNALCTFEHNTE